MSEEGVGSGPGSSQAEGACFDTVNHTEAKMPPAQAATVEMKETTGEKEGVESGATTVCNGVDHGHLNGVEEHVNGVDERAEASESEADASVKSEDSDEDLANVSVPQLIDKFENILVDQGDSDEERSAEYNLKADESQEIPFTVDSAEASQHEDKDIEIAENTNTESVKIEETQPDGDTVEATVTKTIEETVEETFVKEEEAKIEEVVSKEEEEAVDEASSKEEEETEDKAASKEEEETEEEAKGSTAEGSRAETVEDAVTDVAESLVGSTSDDTESPSVMDTTEAGTNNATQEESAMPKDEETTTVESETIGATALDVVQEAASESEVVEEGSEEDESMGEKLVPAQIDVNNGESSNQKETVIDKPGEELDDVEVTDIGEIGTSHKETFLRQDTYTVSSSSVVTTQTSTNLLRQDTYVVEQEEEEVSQEMNEKEVLEQIAEKEILPQQVVEDELQTNSEPIMEYSDEPIYREADGEEEEEEEVKIAKTEDKYVTAEEVRIQKHSLEKKMSSSTTVSSSMTITSGEMVSKTEQLLTRNIKELSGEKTELVEASPANTLPLATLAVAGTLNHREDEEEQKELKEEDVPVQTNDEVEGLEEALLTGGAVTSDDIRRRSDVDQLVEDIRDPGLDSSLESIAAMVEESQLAAPEVDQLRVSPEFATAAELIDKNLDKGFDPDDPAVKGIEDWDCSNNLDAMDPSLDNLRVKSRKLKNSMFKRMSRSEERKSLLETAPTGEEERKEVDEEQKGCGCFTSWLVYIFIKIFD